MRSISPANASCAGWAGPCRQVPWFDMPVAGDENLNSGDTDGACWKIVVIILPHHAAIFVFVSNAIRRRVYFSAHACEFYKFFACLTCQSKCCILPHTLTLAYCGTRCSFLGSCRKATLELFCHEGSQQRNSRAFFQSWPFYEACSHTYILQCRQTAIQNKAVRWGKKWWQRKTFCETAV